MHIGMTSVRPSRQTQRVHAREHPRSTGLQQRLVRHVLAWGAAHPWVRGVIAGDAAFFSTGFVVVCASTIAGANIKPNPISRIIRISVISVS